MNQLVQALPAAKLGRGSSNPRKARREWPVRQEEKLESRYPWTLENKECMEGGSVEPLLSLNCFWEIKQVMYSETTGFGNIEFIESDFCRIDALGGEDNN